MFMELTHKQKIGQIGENLATKNLEKLKFRIIDRNYRKKWGEIDIIAKKDNILHFIEVKSVSCETFFENKGLNEGVSRETSSPEDNVHYWKRKRLKRTIQSYLMDKNVSYEIEWQIDIIAVFINLKTMKAKIRFTEDVVI